ncbi:MAG: DUF4260 family protein [Bacteroidetes bacterium]|jgi:Domain of unknown function (DUF4260)|nr:MAG: DUF4260 family protein [Bacteroidota bacterium]
MNTLLKLEEAAMTLASIALMYLLGVPLSGWVYFLLFFSPDLGMLGYLINTRVGALGYNLFHHKGIAVLVAMAGYFLAMDYLTLAGLLLFGHSSFDRIWGYGLKFPDSFKNTHLGMLK